MATDFPEILTPEELAELLKCSPAVVYKLCDKGVLPYVQFERAGIKRFFKDDILKVLSEHHHQKVSKEVSEG